MMIGAHAALLLRACDPDKTFETYKTYGFFFLREKMHTRPFTCPAINSATARVRDVNEHLKERATRIRRKQYRKATIMPILL